MAKEVEHQIPQNLQSLKTIVQSVWISISQNTIDGLVDLFDKKVRICYNQNGAQVRYH